MDLPASYSLDDGGDGYGMDGSDFWPEEDMTSSPDMLFFGTTPGPTLSSALDINISQHSNRTARRKFRFYQKEQLTFLCILFACIIIGNLCVLVAILLSKNRKSRMNFFIMQLAIADLSTGMITVLTDIIWKTTVEFHAGNVGCKIVKYLQSTVMFASTYVLVALSIDRLDAIARPMHFSGSGKRARGLILIAWGTAMAFSIPMMVLPSEKVHRGLKQCHIHMPEPWHWKLFVTALAVALYVIPAIIIATCYTIIVCIIWTKSSIGASSKPAKISFRFTKKNNSSNGDGSHKYSSGCKVTSQTSQASSRGLIPKARIKTIKMTLVIVLVFIICWSPYFVFDLLDVYGHLPTTQKKIAISIFIQSLAPLNCAANPIIYCLFSTRICSNWRRLPLCDWLAKRFCCCCSEEKTKRHHSFNTSMTEYTTMDRTKNATRAQNAGIANPRRHSSTPYVKGTLTDKESEILLKHIRNGERQPADSAEEVESADDLISAV